MADSKVSGLTAATSVSATDYVYAVVTATSRRLEIQDFFAYLENLVVDDDGHIVTLDGVPVWS